MARELTAKQKMRQKIGASSTKKREIKAKEREEKKESLRISKPSPYQRKHGSEREKDRIDSLAHLSDREKRIKKRNIDAGTPSKSTTTSKKVRGRKLSPYEQRQADRKAAMQQKAKSKHQDYKNLTREQFIKKYPNSNTAKKYGKRTGKRSLIK